MKRFLIELGSAAIILMFAINAHAQQGNCSGSCDPSTPGVSCYLDIHDVYPDPDCNAPNCPGLKVFDTYQCTWYGWPCGDLICIYCAGCASGNCPPGTHVAVGKEKTHAQALLARVRALRAQHLG